MFFVMYPYLIFYELQLENVFVGERNFLTGIEKCPLLENAASQYASSILL